MMLSRSDRSNLSIWLWTIDKWIFLVFYFITTWNNIYPYIFKYIRTKIKQRELLFFNKTCIFCNIWLFNSYNFK